MYTFTHKRLSKHVEDLSLHLKEILILFESRVLLVYISDKYQDGSWSNIIWTWVSKTYQKKQQNVFHKYIYNTGVLISC